MKEKRRYNRYDIELPIRVVINDPGGVSKQICLETINLAAEGILIKKGISLPEGSLIKLEVEFHFEDIKTPNNPDGTLIMSVTGHIIRIEHEGIAIHFDDDYEMSQCLSFLEQSDNKLLLE